DAERPEIGLRIEGEWPRRLQADEGLLRQAFQNLLRNAVEAIPREGGEVVVSGRLERAGSQLRGELTDSGPGIPNEVLGRLFTPAVTTKEPGTGLGLAMAQKTIVCHDGAIEARNLERGGACVTVTLPVNEAELPLAAAEAGRLD